MEYNHIIVYLSHVVNVIFVEKYPLDASYNNTVPYSVTTWFRRSSYGPNRVLYNHTYYDVYILEPSNNKFVYNLKDTRIRIGSVVSPTVSSSSLLLVVIGSLY